MFKKAQAAMEFLMTYGWAILVVLVVIGALAYFGVLSPKKLLPDKCLFGPGIGTCNDYMATGTTLTLELTNGFGETLTLVSEVADGGYCTAAAGGDTTDWTSGSEKTFTFTCADMPAGDKTNEEVTITYTKAGGTLTHTISGQVAITIQP